MDYEEIGSKLVYLKEMLKELEENDIDYKFKRKTYFTISKLVEEIVGSVIKIKFVLVVKILNKNLIDFVKENDLVYFDVENYFKK